MTSSRLVGSTISMLSALLIVFCLYFLSGDRNEMSNGFTRRVLPHKVRLLKRVDLMSEQFYIAGFHSRRLYLGKPSVPLQLLACGDDSTQVIQIAGKTTAIRESKLMIDSPWFYLADMQNYQIYRGALQNWQINTVVHEGAFFTEFMPMRHAGIVQRTFKNDSSSYALVLHNSITGSTIEASDLLQKQLDGFFCTDGMLQFDAITQKLVYTYFYRNEFVSADTTLNLLYRANTIDTTSRARIQVRKVKSRHGSMLASPPFIVNRRSVASGGLLYINSALKADNEDPANFVEVDVIDVYQLSDGAYQHSFYIPRVEGVRLRHFAVYGELLYALHGRFLSAYQLDHPSL